MLPESFVVVSQDVASRFRSLTGERASPPPLAFDEAAGLLPCDFRRFYLTRAAALPFTWARFADVLNDDLIVPLEAVISGAAQHLAEGGLPAAWRGDDDARAMVEHSRAVADATRASLAAERLEDAVASLVAAFHDLAGALAPGPPAAAARDALRRLLPFFGCIVPATAARAWALLGLRGRPSERLADGSLVDEPAPPRPCEPLFPGGPVDPLLAASWCFT